MCLPCAPQLHSHVVPKRLSALTTQCTQSAPCSSAVAGTVYAPPRARSIGQKLAMPPCRALSSPLARIHQLARTLAPLIAPAVSHSMLIPDVYSIVSSTVRCWLSPANSLSFVRKSLGTREPSGSQWSVLRGRALLCVCATGRRCCAFARRGAHMGPCGGRESEGQGSEGQAWTHMQWHSWRSRIGTQGQFQ